MAQSPRTFGRTLFPAVVLLAHVKAFPSDRYFYALVLGGLVIFLLSLVLMMVMGWDVYTVAWTSTATGTLIAMTLLMWVLIKVMYGTSGGPAN